MWHAVVQPQQRVKTARHSREALGVQTHAAAAASPTSCGALGVQTHAAAATSPRAVGPLGSKPTPPPPSTSMVEVAPAHEHRGRRPTHALRLDNSAFLVELASGSAAGQRAIPLVVLAMAPGAITAPWAAAADAAAVMFLGGQEMGNAWVRQLESNPLPGMAFAAAQGGSKPQSCVSWTQTAEPRQLDSNRRSASAGTKP